MEKLAVSVAEAAGMLGLSRASLYPRLLSGEIPSIVVGSRRLVPVNRLEEWLNAQPSIVGAQLTK